MPSFFYVFALPLVACATGWALLFLPSKSTGERRRAALMPGALRASPAGCHSASHTLLGASASHLACRPPAAQAG